MFPSCEFIEALDARNSSWHGSDFLGKGGNSTQSILQGQKQLKSRKCDSVHRLGNAYFLNQSLVIINVTAIAGMVERERKKNYKDHQKMQEKYVKLNH